MSLRVARSFVTTLQPHEVNRCHNKEKLNQNSK